MAGIVNVTEHSNESMKAAYDEAIDADGVSEAYKIQVIYNSGVLLVKKLSENAKLPQKQSNGYYIYTPKDVTISPRGYFVVDTEIEITFPKGTYGSIASVTVWAEKYGLYAAPCSYGPGTGGSIKVTLFNSTNNNFILKAGLFAALLVINAIAEPQVIEITD